MTDADENKTIYRVVINHDEEYSIWPAHRENVLGWRDAVPGKTGTKAECLEHVDAVWVDMRPRSLREKMDEPGSQDREEQK